MPLVQVAGGFDRERAKAVMLDELYRRNLAHHISVKPLPVDETAAMIAAVVGQAPPPALVSEIYDETEGQQRTHKLVDGMLDLLTRFVELTSSALVQPFVQPFQAKMLRMLREAGWTVEI